jgi:co-chaperonin GroES (HSP10)
MSRTREEVEQEVEQVFQCFPGKIILKFEPPADVSEGGIILVRKRLENVGTVVAVGPALDKEDEIIARQAKVGTKVFAYPDYGKKFTLKAGGYKLDYYVFLNYELFFPFPEGLEILEEDVN